MSEHNKQGENDDQKIFRSRCCRRRAQPESGTVDRANAAAVNVATVIHTARDTDAAAPAGRHLAAAVAKSARDRTPVGFPKGESAEKKSDKGETTDTSAKSGRLAAGDQAFAVTAARRAGRSRAGQAGGRACSKCDVKAFGQRMIDDHGKANKELGAILERQGITPPTELKGTEKATYDRLARLSGAAFDKAYISDMVKDHEQDVKEFERESTSGKDADLKAFATKTLPTLRTH